MLRKEKTVIILLLTDSFYDNTAIFLFCKILRLQNFFLNS